MWGTGGAPGGPLAALRVITVKAQSGSHRRSIFPQLPHAPGRSSSRCRPTEPRPQGSAKACVPGAGRSVRTRPMHPLWPRDLRDQCQDADVPFFFKQWGEWVMKDSIHAGVSAFGVLSYNGDWLPNATGWNGRSYDPETQEAYMVRVGKKFAGRLLGWRTWDEYPEVSNA